MNFQIFFCGRGGIRTPDTVSRMPDFKSGAVQPLGYSSIFYKYKNTNKKSTFNYIFEMISNLITNWDRISVFINSDKGNMSGKDCFFFVSVNIE